MMDDRVMDVFIALRKTSIHSRVMIGLMKFWEKIHFVQFKDILSNEMQRINKRFRF